VRFRQHPAADPLDWKIAKVQFGFTVDKPYSETCGLVCLLKHEGVCGNTFLVTHSMTDQCCLTSAKVQFGLTVDKPYSGTNELTCLPKHEGTRHNKFLVTYPMTDRRCLTSAIARRSALTYGYNATLRQIGLRKWL
jgi:hypothetical protein